MSSITAFPMKVSSFTTPGKAIRNIKGNIREAITQFQASHSFSVPVQWLLYIPPAITGNKILVMEK
jgi:hypothetical protein